MFLHNNEYLLCAAFKFRKINWLPISDKCVAKNIAHEMEQFPMPLCANEQRT